MLALAIDTSGDVAGLALGRDDALISELHFRHKMDLLRRLLPNIRSLISDAGLAVKDLDGVIVSLGPGSFTGLRIGVSAAKALAYALEKPIVGVPTLDVIAEALLPAGGLICPMVHAHAGEVYAALYRAEGGALTKVMPEASADVTAIVERLHESGASSVLLAGSGARRNWAALKDIGRLAPSEHDFSRASVLLRMGIERLQAGQADDPFGLVPLYVRRPTPEVRLECR